MFANVSDYSVRERISKLKFAAQKTFENSDDINLFTLKFHMLSYHKSGETPIYIFILSRRFSVLTLLMF